MSWRGIAVCPLHQDAARYVTVRPESSRYLMGACHQSPIADYALSPSCHHEITALFILAPNQTPQDLTQMLNACSGLDLLIPDWSHASSLQESERAVLSTLAELSLVRATRASRPVIVSAPLVRCPCRVSCIYPVDISTSTLHHVDNNLLSPRDWRSDLPMSSQLSHIDGRYLTLARIP